MIIKNLILNHQIKLRHTVLYRFYNDILSITIHDQDEICKNPYTAYRFANLKIPGTDITKCQEAACKNTEAAYWFARDIPGADIEYCQEHVCKHVYYARCFAKDVPGADISYCRKACEDDEYWLNAFDQMIAHKNANIKGS